MGTGFYKGGGGLYAPFPTELKKRFPWLGLIALNNCESHIAGDKFRRTSKVKISTRKKLET